MAKAVQDLLEAFYNVLYKMLCEAVALFMEEGRVEEGGGERGANGRKLSTGDNKWGAPGSTRGDEL